MTQKQRYREDSEYRAAILRRNKVYHDTHKDDPLYHQLRRVRDRIYKTRESYNERLAHAERLFAALEKLIKRREALEAKWHASTNLRHCQVAYRGQLATLPLTGSEGGG